MCPTAQSDGHDAPGLSDEAVPGEAAVVKNVGVGLMRLDSQLSRMNCQIISTGLSSGVIRGQRQQVDVGWDDERNGVMPSRLTEEQDGVDARRDSGGFWAR